MAECLTRIHSRGPQGRPELALTECCGDEFFPGPGLDAHGALAVSPGLIAVVNLAGGGRFVVTTRRTGQLEAASAITALHARARS